jgi:hypothetical protein
MHPAHHAAAMVEAPIATNAVAQQVAQQQLIRQRHIQLRIWIGITR